MDVVPVAARSAVDRMLGLWVRIPSGAWLSVSCDCCVLSCRGLCVGLITRPEGPYRMCIIARDREASIMRRPRPKRGCWAL